MPHLPARVAGHTGCMKLFKFFSDSHAAAPEAAHIAVANEGPVERRRPATTCANCLEARHDLVYLENGRDYCPACAVRCWEQMRFQPAGRRSGDLTLAQLLN